MHLVLAMIVYAKVLFLPVTIINTLHVILIEAV